MTFSETLVPKNTPSKKVCVSLWSHSRFLCKSQLVVSGMGLLLGDPTKKIIDEKNIYVLKNILITLKFLTTYSVYFVNTSAILMYQSHAVNIMS